MSKDAAGNTIEAAIIPRWLLVMIGLVVLSCFVMLIKYLATFGVQTSHSQEVWGQFGDFFGGILNPLLSSLTLAAVLVTMRLQSKELKVAQEENKRANEHLEKQASYIRTQNFESVFFRLLDVHMVSRAGVSTGTRSGTDAFNVLVNRSASCFSALSLASETTASSQSALANFRKDFTAIVGEGLNVYCRGLYQVIKYVDTYEGLGASDSYLVENKIEGLTSEEKLKLRREQDRAYRPIYFAKRQYVNMLRAQLTQAELKMLFLSCLTEKGSGLKYLAEKYSLFKGLDKLVDGKPDFANNYYSYLAFADYEDIKIRHVRLLDAVTERVSMNKRRHVSSRSFKMSFNTVFSG